MSEETVFHWNGGQRGVYARLLWRDGDWRVEWGHRERQETDFYLPVTVLDTPNPNQAARWLVSMVQSLDDAPLDGDDLRRSILAAMFQHGIEDRPAEPCRLC
jgi:hypothetical protein